MKKILYIHFNGTYGGASKSLLLLAKDISKSYNVSVLTPKGSYTKELLNNKIQTKVIPKIPEFSSINSVSFQYLKIIFRLKYFFNIFRIRKIVKADNPDIIHFNEGNMVLLLYFLRKLPAKKIIHIRSVSDSKKKFVNKIVTYLLNKYSDKVVFIDKSVQQSFPKIKKYNIVHNPIPLHQEIRLKEHVNFNVLFLGFLSKAKGIYDVVEMARILLPYKNIKIKIAGNFPKINNKYLSFVLKTTRLFPDVEKHIKDSILINKLNNIELLGFVKDYKSLVQITDTLIFPSHLDGIGRSVFEVGVHGIPSIVTLKNKFDDIVVDNVTGIIVDPKSPNQLAEAILKLYKNEDLRTEFGNNAKNKCLLQHSHSTISNKMVEIYKKTLSSQT